MKDYLSQLRGGLPAEEPGARGIEAVARNPDCVRLRALTSASLTPAKAAEILGVPAKEGQSPLALAFGQRFERHVLDNGAANLFALYHEEGLLGLKESKFVAIDDLAPITPNMPRDRLARALKVREDATRTYLEAKRKGDPSAPNIIRKPRLFIDLAGVAHAIEPDYLVAADAEVFYRTGELKSYADRGGKTNQANIRSACRQAGVGVVALRQYLKSKGMAKAEAMVIAEADLVLKVYGLFVPTFNRMGIRGEISSIERAISEAPTTLQELAEVLPPGASFADPETIRATPNNYRASCKEFCALWEHCRAQAHHDRRPIVLGEQAAEILAAAGSLDRAIELMHGTGTPPRNRAEATLAADLRASHHNLKKAVGHD